MYFTIHTKAHLSNGFPLWKYISQKMKLVLHTIESFINQGCHALSTISYQIYVCLLYK